MTAGCPFHSGWGLTDDRQPNPASRRALSTEALFAGAYLLYPRYFNPETGAQTSFEAIAAAIRRQLKEPAGVSRPRPAWTGMGPYGIFGWRHFGPIRCASSAAFPTEDSDSSAAFSIRSGD